MDDGIFDYGMTDNNFDPLRWLALYLLDSVNLIVIPSDKYLDIDLSIFGSGVDLLVNGNDIELGVS